MGAPFTDLRVDLLSKLASIAIHAAELRSPTNHPMDGIALDHLLGDPQVRAWLQDMSKIALAPRTRDGAYP